MSARPALLAVDAGGTHTRAVVCHDGRSRSWELATMNRHAVGATADDVLLRLLSAVRHEIGDRPCVGWLASASVDPDEPAAELRRITAGAVRAGLDARLVVSNDVVPLLWGLPGVAGEGIAVICGTGSGFLGVDRTGAAARAGGCEYLGSDEGAAVDIGRRGLRAAVRAGDGRGPATVLTGLLADATGTRAPQLARAIAAQPYPKQRLADLAPMVCAGWLSGDQVCGGIVSDAVTDLVAGVRAVRDRLRLTGGYAVVTVGGVFAGCPPFHDLIESRLLDFEGAGQVTFTNTSARVVMAALEHLLDDRDEVALPAAISDRHAWIVSSAPAVVTRAEEEMCA
ncbi:hypothetical protein AMIS_32180 [Actinoplanes missouriensis 431]|uniref:ATPase BadF/BadG/BcrA/BcrD type domain-containing protein n=1 Tax=Actinoplanes missouriensis (strain ATCC 14538 / DSM 43046 / CBS 188.64 / JCM 3121 / NBRC 102363 / NCIMB 12654 / NRRL B-3342 / UNCC 431) TaxID=512565 RepID=I0H601_ACTM4|nr:BadF/BadG/BcrA/BcrD ATPase family protein [Actinoplanes missouriensis]BAL88438.1 hypothetical protein AMIS_32180 [Actinoplanes missouriensis 431]